MGLGVLALGGLDSSVAPGSNLFSLHPFLLLRENGKQGVHSGPTWTPFPGPHRVACEGPSQKSWATSRQARGSCLPNDPPSPHLERTVPRVALLSLNHSLDTIQSLALEIIHFFGSSSQPAIVPILQAGTLRLREAK